MHSSVPTTPQMLFHILDDLKIEYKTTQHPPAFTVAEGNKHWGNIPGVHCKNLFLKDAKGKLWLIVAPANAHINLKTLPQRIGSKRLSFGNENLLFDVLGIHPGSVTPFSVINDKENKVSVVLDKSMMQSNFINYHPLENTATTTLTPEGLKTFLRYCKHDFQIVDVIETEQNT